MEVAIVADDLTGAADSAVMFAGGERRLEILLGPAASGTAGVVAIDTASREQAPAVGAYRVTTAVAALRGAAPRLWYKKLDSTLRGNVASELDAFIRATGCSLVLVAPAYPAQGRTTVDSIQRYAEMPERSDHRHDLVALLAPLGRPLLRIGLPALGKGPHHVAELLRQAPYGAIVVGDALTEGHLAVIAGAVLAGEREGVVLAGSAGLAGALRRQRYPEATAPLARLAGAAALLIVGTLHPASLRQLATAQAELRLPAMELANPGEAATDTGCFARRRLLEQLGNGGSSVMRSPSALAPAAGDVTVALACRAAELIAEADVRRVFVTGGEVARALFDRLGIRRLAVRGAVADGMPALTALDGRTGLEVVTKAGGFGGDRAILQAAAYLRGDEAWT